MASAEFMNFVHFSSQCFKSTVGKNPGKTDCKHVGNGKKTRIFSSLYTFWPDEFAQQLRKMSHSSLYVRDQIKIQPSV